MEELRNIVLSRLQCVLFSLVCVCLALNAHSSGIENVKYELGGRTLVLEVLGDDLLHFQLAEKALPTGDERIPTTPMIARTDYSGPTQFSRDGYILRSATTQWRVIAEDLSIEVTDLRTNKVLTYLTGENLGEETMRMRIGRYDTRNVYGLGNFFVDPNTTDGDWVGRQWSGEGMGNVRAYFHGFGPSYSQFPMLYALGSGKDTYGLFLDTAKRFTFSFQSPDNWFVESWGDALRGYVFTGNDVKAVRGAYMDLVGRPPVPPRSSLGLWVSKFGYDSWPEIWNELQSMRRNRMPVDGFALDLQWFGGGFGDPNNASMGSLRFDEAKFPNPAHEIDWLRNVEGINLMPIEEPYVDERLPEHRALQHGACPGCARICEQFLVKANADELVRFGTEAQPTWWGRGGIIDYSNPRAGLFWHNFRRHLLARMGIVHHWNDLGEPEMYSTSGWYHGFNGIHHTHGDIHNLYGFSWAQSIAAGYAERENQRDLIERLNLVDAPRHFIMARAGAPGIQRFGAGMWSGDVARNPGSLRAHLNSQMHMSMLGIDGYNSDVGGFANTDVGQEDGGHGPMDPRLYTQWFASSALGEYPLRPHGWAYGAEKTEYGPDRRGHLEANRANLIQRYELIPYYYSLAHRAHRYAEPMFPPLAYHFQDDLNARTMASVKMVGDALLYGVLISYTAAGRSVYLPQGRWVDYHSLDWHQSQGGETAEIPAFRDRHGETAVFTLPLFARSGAIIPKMLVDGMTMNSFGRRMDGSVHDALVARVFADRSESTFTVYEDDGQTLAYQKGKVLETRISQQLHGDDGSAATIAFHSTTGETYEGAPSEREYLVELVVDDRVATGVSLNGEGLQQVSAQDVMTCVVDGAGCWANVGRNLIVARSRRMPIAAHKSFAVALTPTASRTSIHIVCNKGETIFGESAVYAIGNIPQLGGWDPARAVRLVPVNYPQWSLEIRDLAPGTFVEWKCIKRREGGNDVLVFQNPRNSEITTGGSGFAGTSHGSF